MKHLNEVKENYFKHLMEAFLISISLVAASLACIVHGIVPQLFTKTASTIMKKILDRTESRYAK